METEEAKKAEGAGVSFIARRTDPGRFKVLANGWVRDNLLDIDWAPSSEETMEFSEAQQYCKDLGGRMPTIDELQSLVDYSKHEPAIVNKEVFADTKTDDWYWAGDITAWTKDAAGYKSAWCVSFNYGYVGSYDVGYGSYVRPVRASQ